MSQNLKEFLNCNSKIDSINVYAVDNDGRLTTKVKISANGRNESFLTDIDVYSHQSIIIQIINPLISYNLADKINICSPDINEFAMQQSRHYHELPADTINIVNKYIEDYA